MNALKMIYFNNVINFIKVMNLYDEFHNDMDFIMRINIFKRLSFTNLMNLIIWDELHNCNGDLYGDEFTQVIYFITVKDFKEVMNLVDLMN